MNRENKSILRGLGGRLIGDLILPGILGDYTSDIAKIFSRSDSHDSISSSVNELDLAEMLRIKIESDFGTSAFKSKETFNIHVARYKARQLSMSQYETNRKLKIDEVSLPIDEDWVRFNFNRIQDFVSFYFIQKKLEPRFLRNLKYKEADLIENLCNIMENARPVSVRCESIHAGAIASLCAMQSKLSLKSKLDLDLSSSMGTHLIASVHEDRRLCRELPDYLIVAAGAFNLGGGNRERVQNYLPCFPIHLENQYLLQRPKLIKKLTGRNINDISDQKYRIHYHIGSSCEEEFLLLNSKNDRISGEPYLFFEEIPQLLDSRDNKDLMACWDPFAEFYKKKYQATQVHKTYHNVIGLYQHKDLLRDIGTEACQAFKELFLIYWMIFFDNRELAREYFTEDVRAMLYFKKALRPTVA